MGQQVKDDSYRIFPPPSVFDVAKCWFSYALAKLVI